MKPFHGVGDVHKPRKCDVELVIAGGHAAKDRHALKKIFSQMACLVAVRAQDARVLFAVDPARDDKLFGLSPTQQFRQRFGVVTLACGSAQSAAGWPVRGIENAQGAPSGRLLQGGMNGLYAAIAHH